jgi:hypothetical protein
VVPGPTLHLYQLIQVEQGEFDVNNILEMSEFKILPPLFLAHNKKIMQNFKRIWQKFLFLALTQVLKN